MASSNFLITLTPMTASRTKPTSVALPKDVIAKGKAKAEQDGYESFSRYIEALILMDLADHSAHYVIRDQGEVIYGRARTDNPFSPPPEQEKQK